MDDSDNQIDSRPSESLIESEDGTVLSRDEVRSLIDELEASLDRAEDGPDAPLHVVKTSEHVSVSVMRGPLPPAGVLAEYEKMCPGSADRIIAMAERQSEHRMDMDIRVLQANVEADADDRNKEYRLSVLGSILSCLVLVVLVIVGAICILFNKGAAGVTSIAVALGGMGGLSFFNMKKSKTSKQAEKDKEANKSVEHSSNTANQSASLPSADNKDSARGDNRS